MLEVLRSTKQRHRNSFKKSVRTTRKTKHTSNLREKELQKRIQDLEAQKDQESEDENLLIEEEKTFADDESKICIRLNLFEKLERLIAFFVLP